MRQTRHAVIRIRRIIVTATLLLAVLAVQRSSARLAIGLQVFASKPAAIYRSDSLCSVTTQHGDEIAISREGFPVRRIIDQMQGTLGVRCSLRWRPLVLAQSNKRFMSEFQGSRYASRGYSLASFEEAAHLGAGSPEYVAVLHNATLLGGGEHYPHVLHDRFIVEHNNGCGGAQSLPNFHRQLESARFFNEAVLLTQKWGGEVFHFIIENLSKLGTLFLAGVRFDAAIVLVEARRRHVTDYLAEFGVSEEQVVRRPVKSEVAYVSKLYFPSQQRCGAVSATAIHGLRQLLAHKRPDVTALWNMVDTNPLVVLIQRSHSRRLHNHEELLRGLSASFRVEVFHEMSVAQTVKLFARAAVVVGPHGAGFSNIIFCRDGVGVVEISHPDSRDLNLCYFHTATVTKATAYALLSFDSSAGWRVNVHEVVVATTRVMNAVVENWKARHAGF